LLTGHSNSKNVIKNVIKVYLGVKVSSCSDLYEEVKSQANKASTVAGCLKATVWRNKDMLKESKVKIYKTCIRPILTYGIESRADTVRTKSLQLTKEMKTLRPLQEQHSRTE
jgi:hypothetical protein